MDDRKGGFTMFKRSVIKEKMMEALRSVLPLAVVILLLCFTLAPMEAGVFLGFLCGCVMLVVGIGLFSLGSEIAMTPMGDYMGAKMAKSRKGWLIVVMSFLVGTLITISEPDLQVLAKYVPSVDTELLILSVGAGVGAFLVVSMLRVLFRIPLRYLLLSFYLICFGLALFVPSDFWAIAFDAGGVTTGPITVPFLISLGVGVSAIRADKDGGNDSFGFVALCSIGPIMAVLVLGLLCGTQGGMAELPTAVPFPDSRQMALAYLHELPHYLFEVVRALAPIALLFFIYQFLTGRVGKAGLIRIGVGLIYTILGLTLFLTGANVGFMPAGYLLGEVMGGDSVLKWLLIPLGGIIGYFLVAAEPAIQVLEKQVEEVTAGAIPRRALSVSLGVGVAVSVAIAMLRAMTGISVMWFLGVGYAVALILTFFSGSTFTAIAFDSGGVASGPMTATFLLAMAMGVCQSAKGNLVTDAFGMVAMVAMTPLVAIQLLGVVYRIKVKRAQVATPVAQEPVYIHEEVIDF